MLARVRVVSTAVIVGEGIRTGTGNWEPRELVVIMQVMFLRQVWSSPSEAGNPVAVYLVEVEEEKKKKKKKRKEKVQTKGRV